ncbi:hypothetical protein SAMN05421823_10132 [Catalinimonas alkaloidigena]|uniref:Urease accessory protein UreH-like transmembrane domain-containing protein n=1 Tax=Catalinimonas alkaloidigena TaxID=1075417 RepID=A0A1G8WCC2_9BACT|nr:sulfite exporter TauE/SafE family protein [Catalinimonas alkaloidigena]SDJ75841.1 hypothetical protein SAMN05421823_10132 [Catalinimonas alkaloidigena]
MLLWTAFVAGMIGSFHCVGMCGPIALAIPGRTVLNRLAYQLGRVLTYAALGAVVGLLGRSFVQVGWQHYLALTVGLLMLLLAGLPSTWAPPVPGLYHLTNGLKAQFRALLGQRSLLASGMVGILNGLLPCGLVYVALAGAVVSGDSLQGAAYMALFGLGTLPLMLAVSLAGGLIPVPVRQRMRRAVPLFIVGLGLLFILRGLNLGIPYVSPKLPVAKASSEVVCH